MAQPYVGEIRLFAGNFAPAGWAFCDGALLAIAENDTLFVLIGTTYGGDGFNTFGLPDPRGRVPVPPAVLAERVMLLVPAAVGVPERRPLVVSAVTPDGRPVAL